MQGPGEQIMSPRCYKVTCFTSDEYFAHFLYIDYAMKVWASTARVMWGTDPATRCYYNAIFIAGKGWLRKGVSNFVGNIILGGIWMFGGEVSSLFSQILKTRFSRFFGVNLIVGGIWILRFYFFWRERIFFRIVSGWLIENYRNQKCPIFWSGNVSAPFLTHDSAQMGLIYVLVSLRAPPN